MWLALAACNQSPQHPALEVKGIPLGATKEQLLERMPSMTCKGNDCGTQAHDDFGGAETTGYMASFRDGKLGSFYIRFKQSGTDQIIGALTEKYGKPTQTSRQQMQNAFGARYESRGADWRFPEGSIIVEQRGGSADEGVVMMQADWYDAGNKAADTEKIKAGAKKL